MRVFHFIGVSIIFVVLLLSDFYLIAQQKPIKIDGYTILPWAVIDGDTIPNVFVQQVVVFPQRKFASNRDYRQYQKLVRNLKIVYPYAQIVKYKISEMDRHYRTLKSNRERKNYTNQVEKELRAEFEHQLVKLTITQGRLLIKLVDRELGRTSYDIIRDLKGGVSAVFWQTVARIFGSNLKSEFNPAGEDKILNELIILYEHGLI
jgi:hypothetical protein